MKYSPAPLTPFLASPPENSPLLTLDRSPLFAIVPDENPSALCSLLFSRAYKLPPPPHRFASHAFSSTYKSLFSQLPCFQKHLRCPLVFPNPARSDRNSRLSTVDCRLPLAVLS